MSQQIHYKCPMSRSQGQRSRSQRNVAYQFSGKKRYRGSNTATDWLTDLNLDVVIKKAQGSLKLQCIAVATFSSCFINGSFAGRHIRGRDVNRLNRIVGDPV